MAFTDTYEELKSRPSVPRLWAGGDHLSGEIESLAIRGDDRATLTARFLSRQMIFHSDMDSDPWLSFHSTVSGWAFDVAYEMVKQNGSWYVTGLSTFPESRERESIAELVDDYIASAQSSAPAPLQEE